MDNNYIQNEQKDKNELINGSQSNPVNEEQNRLDEPAIRQVFSSEERESINKAKADAMKELNDKLVLQQNFDITYKEMNFASSQEQLESQQMKMNEVEKIAKEEDRLIKLKEEYGIKKESTESDDVDKIFNQYFQSQFGGDIEQQIQQLNQRKEYKKNKLLNQSKDISSQIEAYHKKAENEKEQRRQRVNERFNSDKTISSKGKKRDGRKKGLQLVEKNVIGATEETHAMMADMQHRQKDLDKWDEKGNKLKFSDDEMKLTGDEFKLVFKNRSGSSMNVKAVMEKLYKMKKKIESLGDDDPKKAELIENRKLLHNTFRIVCAANGIDEKNNSLFKQDSPKEKEETRKKVEYANAVYQSVLDEYEKKVKGINISDKPVLKDKIEEDEPVLIQKTKDEILEADKKSFINTFNAMREKKMGTKQNISMRNFISMAKKSKMMPDAVWNAALNMCDSYDASLYQEKENGLKQRKEKLEQEKRMLSDLLDGNSEKALDIAIQRISQLSSGGVNIDSYLEGNIPENRETEYARIAAAITLFKHAFSYVGVDKGLEELRKTKILGENDQDIFKRLVKLSSVGNDADSEMLFQSKIRSMNKVLPDWQIDDYTMKMAFGLCGGNQNTKEKMDILSCVLEKNSKGIFDFASQKLNQLKEKGITFENAFDINKVMQNPEEYRQLGYVIQLLNQEKNKADNKEIFDELLKQYASNLEGYKELAMFSAFDKYAEKLGKVKGKKESDERQKKVLEYNIRKMKENCKRIAASFDKKWTKENISEAKPEDIFAVEESMESQCDKSELQPIYSESINELLDYYNGLREKKAEMRNRFDTLVMVNEINGHAKDYFTAVAMKKRYEKRVSEIDGKIRDIKKEKNEKTKYTKKQEESYQKTLDKLNGLFNDYSKYDGQRRILDEILLSRSFISDEKVKEKIDRIKELRPDSRLNKRFDTYIIEKKKVEKKALLAALGEKIYLKAIDFSYAQNVDDKINAENAYLEYLAQYKEENNEDYDDEKEKEKLKNKTQKVINEWRKTFVSADKIVEAAQPMITKDKKREQDASRKEYQEKSGQKVIQSVSENTQEIENTPFDILMNECEESRLRQIASAKGKQQEIEKIIKGLSPNEYNYILSKLSDEQINTYIGNKNAIILQTKEDIDKMLEDSKKKLKEKLQRLLNEESEAGKRKYNPEDYKELKSVKNSQKLNDLLDKGGEIPDEIFENCFKNFYKEGVAIKADQAAMDKIDKEIEKVYDLLNEEINGETSKEKEKDNQKKEFNEIPKKEYEMEEMEAAYKENQAYTKKCFEMMKGGFVNNTKRLILDMVNEQMGGKTTNNIKMQHLKDTFPAYMEKTNALISEKNKQFQYHGINYNSLALQSFLTDTTKDKYELIRYENMVKTAHDEKKKYNAKDDYLIKNEDLLASSLEDGATTIDFKKLMYKRDRLMKWLEANKNLATKDDENMGWFSKLWDRSRSPRQRRYDRRQERLEKLNNYLKCYCEANGVNFVTGELICEMEMTEEEIKNRVMTANMYLEEATTDLLGYIKNSDEEEFDDIEDSEDEKEEEEAKGILATLNNIKKFWDDNSSTDKDLIEEFKRNQFAELTNVYEKTFQYEAKGLEHTAVKRTRHFRGEITNILGECKAACKVGVGVGTVTDKVTGKESKTLGLTVQANAAVTLLSSEMQAKYGGKIAGMEADVHGEAKLEIGKASANANLVATLFKDGKFSPAAQLDLGAELAILKLEAAVGTKMFGVGLDAKFSLMFGLAARFNLEIKDWKFRLDAAAAFGIGFSAGIEFDLSEFKDKIVEMAQGKADVAKQYVVDKMIAWKIAPNSEFVRKFMENNINKMFTKENAFGNIV